MVQDEQQKVRTITALALAALAEAGRLFFPSKHGELFSEKMGLINLYNLSMDLPEPFKLGFVWRVG